MDEYPNKRLGELVEESLQTASRTARRLAYVGFALFAFALVLVGKIDARLIDGVRSLVADATAPALDVFSYPLMAADEALSGLQELADLRSENQRLREENARLAALRLSAHQLRQENESLRRLLRFDPGPAALSISTRVIADTGGLYARSVLVHVGTANGIRSGMPVIGANGLVGRVESVGRNAARVLLITDLNSKIPVAIGKGRLRAIMSGRNDATPALEFFTFDEAPKPGSLVVTSGDGGMFHPGLPIGIVEAGEGGGWRVRPFADWDLLDFVRIVDYREQELMELADKRRPGQ